MQEDVLRRLASIVRERLRKLKKNLDEYADARDTMDVEEPEIVDTLGRDAQQEAENLVHLVRVLLRSGEALSHIRLDFEERLPSEFLTFEWDEIDEHIKFADFPIVPILERFLDLGVAAHGAVVSGEQLFALDRICESLGATIGGLNKACGLPLPNGETPVKKLGFELIKAVFPDALPDGNVSFHLANNQVRKPDAAIPSLRTCIEFKFADDAKALGKALDELAADISAYGDARYDIFRGVIYAPYSEDAKADFDQMWKERRNKFKSTTEWVVFVAYGPGGRSKRLQPGSIGL